MWLLPLASLLCQHILALEVQDEFLIFKSIDDRRCVMQCDGTYECYDYNGNCEALEKHYNLNDDANSKIRDLLLYGHNGLRNRLAKKLNSCDMLQMSWDLNLADLASRQHEHCTRQLFCNIMDNRTKSEDSSQSHLVDNSNSTNISQNSYFLNNIYSRNFIEFALGMWYDSHTQLSYPTKVDIETKTYYQLLGDNSFTHIINPNAHRIGCSYAAFIDGLSLICYYYPHNNSNKVLLRVKPPHYHCPHTFPILDTLFQMLCKYARYTQNN